MKFKLHHVGLVVPSIAEYNDLFSFAAVDKVIEPKPEPVQKVNISFIPAIKDEDFYIELIEPLCDDSPISKFLNKGGGMHHLCFEVDNIEEAGKELTDKGFKMVSPPADCIGIDHCFNHQCQQPSKVAFFLSNKFLIELLEKGV